MSVALSNDAQTLGNGFVMGPDFPQFKFKFKWVSSLLQLFTQAVCLREEVDARRKARITKAYTKAMKAFCRLERRYIYERNSRITCASRCPFRLT